MLVIEQYFYRLVGSMIDGVLWMLAAYTPMVESGFVLICFGPCQDSGRSRTISGLLDFQVKQILQIRFNFLLVFGNNQLGAPCGRFRKMSGLVTRNWAFRQILYIYSLTTQILGDFYAP